MKKLYPIFCITLCLLFSSAAITVRADDGNGHDPGYACAGTADCTTNSAQPQPYDPTPDTSNDTAEDTSLTFLELIITLLPKSF